MARFGVYTLQRFILCPHLTAKKVIHLLPLLALFPVFTRAQLLQFTPNLGQWEESFHFRAAVPGGEMYVESDGVRYVFYDPGLGEWLHPTAPPSPKAFEKGLWHHAIKVELLGTSGTQHWSGENEAPGYSNFYLGNDPSRWKSGIKSFRRIRGSGVYPGIDQVWYEHHGRLKYDFVVNPGALPGNIAFEISGADRYYLMEGKLYIHTTVNEIAENKPFAYQLNGSLLEEVPCGFTLENGIVRFEIGEYDPSRPLIIDPELSFATYSGSSANNFGFTATDDSEGNLYAGSIAYANGYPTTLGAFQTGFNGGNIDAVLTKFSADGSQLLFSSYLGGSGQEMPHSIIVNSQDELIVMGNTGSTNFPVMAGSYDTSFNGGPLFNFIDVSFGNMTHNSGCDIFVSRFSADGTALMGSTYVGGTANDGLNIGAMLHYNYGDVFRGEVIVDPNDRIYVASVTSSTDFPTAGIPSQAGYGGGTTDAVVFRLSSDLSDLEWSTYWGGADSDSGYSVQLDGNGMVFLAGGTRGFGYTTTPGAHDVSYGGEVDGFIAKFSPAGGPVLASTFVGTDLYDQCYFVQTDGEGSVFALGQSKGTMPITPGIYSNANGKQFIRKYSNDLQSLTWSTRFGSNTGEVDISPSAFLVSDCDQIYVSGWGGNTNNVHSPYIDNSSTAGLPITPNAFQASSDGSDFYLMVLGPDAATLEYATFFGGNLSNEHVDGGTSKFDKRGSVYQAVCAGCGGWDDFPTTPGAWSTQNNSSCNLGVFKFDLAQINAEIALEGPAVICQGTEAQFQNLSSGGSQFVWDFGDDNSSTEFEPQHLYEEPGEYVISLSVLDDNDCLQPDTATISITVIPGVNPAVEPFEPPCLGASVVLQGSGSENAYWEPNNWLVSNGDQSATISPEGDAVYFFVDFNECGSDTVEVEMPVFLLEHTVSGPHQICLGQEVQISATGGLFYAWTPEESLSNANLSSPVASPETSTWYYVDITSAEGCEVSDSVFVEVFFDPPGGTMYPALSMCYGIPVQAEAIAAESWQWSPAQWVNDPTIQSPLLNPPVSTLFTVDIVNACGSGTDSVWVEVVFAEALASPDTAVCLGEPVLLWASGGISYDWRPDEGLSDAGSSETLALPTETTVYTVRVTDSNGCADEEEVVVTIWPLPVVEAGLGDIIEWFESSSVEGVVSSEHAFWWTPEEYVECENCLETTVFPDTTMWFTLHAVDENGCEGRDSVEVVVYGPLFAPNTFTPNDDGKNDVFYVVGLWLDDFELEIYDRWGEKIYASRDPKEGWNGTFRGIPCQIDTYVWKVKYRHAEKGNQILYGHVNLVR